MSEKKPGQRSCKIKGNQEGHVLNIHYSLSQLFSNLSQLVSSDQAWRLTFFIDYTRFREYRFTIDSRGIGIFDIYYLFLRNPRPLLLIIPAFASTSFLFTIVPAGLIISVNKNRYHDCQNKQRSFWIPAFAGMTAMLNRL